MSRLSLYWHTLRHLRTEQIVYQLYYRFARGLIVRRAMVDIGEVTRRSWRQPWRGLRVMESAQIEAGVFRFLGVKAEVRTATDWNDPKRSKLWLYNLHYLNDLNARDANAHVQRNEELIERWIRDNPPMQGNGWEPYPISLRIVNLVKWYARGNAMSSARMHSLARQAQALSVQVERHIMANHLFANAKALTFVGAFLAGPAAQRWLQQGLKLLDREVPEQFLADGGHFERSPMYHGILLWDLCDLIHLAQSSDLPELAERVEYWRQVLRRGLRWLETMSHPDGEVAFFNDAAFGISPRPCEIRSYAHSVLGAIPGDVDAKDLDFIHLRDSGYITVDLGDGHKALLDVGEVGPTYQPGHAHADTLSFELSLYGHRVLVNSGTSVYGEGPERQRQRSTAAHNTVEIDGYDSSEVWAGFRVARRAKPVGLEIANESDVLMVKCSHNGYHWLTGAPRHTRYWRFRRGHLQIVDRIDGVFRRAVARWYLHPEIRVEGGNQLVLPSGQRIRWFVQGGEAHLVPSAWYPYFGRQIPNVCIEFVFCGPEIKTELLWG